MNDAESKPSKINIIRDIVYGEGINRRRSKHGKISTIDLLGDFYTADVSVDRPRPCAILIHGGSWERGTRKQQGWWANPAVRRGYAAFCPDHRLSYQATFPAALEDIKCAVRFLREHAEEYGIDPNKIAIAGGSAGAHLAMKVALTPGKWEGAGGHFDYSSEVQAAVSIAGPTFLPSIAWKGYLQRLIGGPIWGIGIDRYLEASPYCYVHKNMPPLLMQHGTKDQSVPYSQSANMQDLCVLMYDIKNVELSTIKGGRHNFLMTEEAKELHLGEMYDWLDKVLSFGTCQ